jgi:hypothetical protein
MGVTGMEKVGERGRECVHVPEDYKSVHEAVEHAQKDGCDTLVLTGGVLRVSHPCLWPHACVCAGAYPACYAVLFFRVVMQSVDALSMLSWFSLAAY